MGQTREAIDPATAGWIARQPVFFVATAPLAASGHVNVSPKGGDTLRVLGPREIAWLDGAGSGIETISHLRENGRIVVMWCAFEGPPRILRCHGRGEAIDAADPRFEALRARFPPYPSARAIIRIEVDRIADSCGYGVPRMDLVAARSDSADYVAKASDKAIHRYLQDNNRSSIDGLPGLAPAAIDAVRIDRNAGRGGAALSVAVVGTESLARFTDFYGGRVGLDATAETVVGGEAFERHFALPPGSTARAVMMSLGGSPVGCVLGLQFDAPRRRTVSDGKPGPFIGYWNLNFYVDDIRAACAALEADGYAFWSRPVSHTMAGDAGAPIEAIFVGPDNVAINLVELAGEGGSTVAALRREVASLPKTRTGWTQVSTSAHGTRDAEAAAAFYGRVLGMTPAIDTVLESPEVNRITGRPPEARSRVVWMRGAHPYGKVAFSQPLNYTMPDRTRDAVAPAIGYLAQGFEVPDLDAALAAAVACGAERVSSPDTVPLAAGFAPRAAMLRVPGSGALAQLLEAR